MNRKEADVRLRIAATAFESQDGMFVADERDVVLQVNNAFNGHHGPCGGGCRGEAFPESSGRIPMTRTCMHRPSARSTRRDPGMARSGTGARNGELYTALVTVTAVKRRLGPDHALRVDAERTSRPSRTPIPGCRR